MLRWAGTGTGTGTGAGTNKKPGTGAGTGTTVKFEWFRIPAFYAIVHLSDPAAARRWCGPDGQEISIDCCTAGGQ